MICKCGNPMSDLDAKRKKADGSYVDTCHDCYLSYITYQYDLELDALTVEIDEVGTKVVDSP